MQKILFEAYNVGTNNSNSSIVNPCYKPLGFATQLLSLAGYDPMSLSPVFAATQRICNSIGLMPWELKAYDENDNISKRHFFYHLFDNCLQSQFIFTKQLIKDVITEGNGYAYIQRDETGKPLSLVYLQPGVCSPVIDTLHNKLIYNISYNGKLTKPVQATDILHFFMNSRDGLIGKSLLSFADKSIRLAAYTEKAASDYFGSGMRLTGILTTDSPRLKDEQREELRNNYLAGINSEKGIAVLEAGMRFEQLSNNAKDAQLIDSRLYNVQEIGRFYNISPQLLGDLSHSLYGTIEASSMDFVSNTLAPYVRMFEDELNRKLLTEIDKKKYYISLEEDVLIQSDRSSYASYLSTLLDKGVISINEARTKLGMPKIDEGDKFIIPYQGTTQDNSYNNQNQLDKNIDKENNE